MSGEAAGQAARRALESAIVEHVTANCTDEACGLCSRQVGQLMDLADDYAGAGLPDNPIAADNARLRKEREQLLGRLGSVRQLMTDAAANGMIDSQAILDLIAAPPAAAQGRPAPGHVAELAALRKLLRLNRQLVVTLRRIGRQQEDGGHAEAAYATGCAATMVEALWPVCNEKCTDTTHHHQPEPEPAGERPAPELAADAMHRVRELTSGILGVAENLEQSAAVTVPSAKSRAEAAAAKMIRGLLDVSGPDEASKQAKP